MFVLWQVEARLRAWTCWRNETTWARTRDCRWRRRKEVKKELNIQLIVIIFIIRWWKGWGKEKGKEREKRKEEESQTWSRCCSSNCNRGRDSCVRGGWRKEGRGWRKEGRSRGKERWACSQGRWCCCRGSEWWRGIICNREGCYLRAKIIHSSVLYIRRERSPRKSVWWGVQYLLFNYGKFIFIYHHHPCCNLQTSHLFFIHYATNNNIRRNNFPSNWEWRVWKGKCFMHG